MDAILICIIMSLFLVIGYIYSEYKGITKTQDLIIQDLNDLLTLSDKNEAGDDKLIRELRKALRRKNQELEGLTALKDKELHIAQHYASTVIFALMNHIYLLEGKGFWSCYFQDLRTGNCGACHEGPCKNCDYHVVVENEDQAAGAEWAYQQSKPIDCSDCENFVDDETHDYCPTKERGECPNDKRNNDTTGPESVQV